MSTKSRTMLNRWLKFAQFLLWPGTCILCRQPSQRPHDLCVSCAATLIETPNPCPGCGLPLPLPPGHGTALRCGACHGPRPLAQVLAPYAWQPPLNTLVSHYKYHAQLQHGRVLGTLLLPHIRHRYDPATLPQLLVPVPLHPQRLRQRGYNQALLLARQLGQALDIPVSHSLVQRQRNTTPQQGLSASARRHNLDGAFILADPTPAQGLQRIALVDDVITTMSTLNALARVLHQQLPGPLTLHGWAIARA